MSPKIVLTIKGEKKEFTTHEARALYDKLEEIFGNRKPIGVVPVIVIEREAQQPSVPHQPFVFQQPTPYSPSTTTCLRS